MKSGYVLNSFWKLNLFLFSRCLSALNAQRAPNFWLFSRRVNFRFKRKLLKAKNLMTHIFHYSIAIIEHIRKSRVAIIITVLWNIGFWGVSWVYELLYSTMAVPVSLLNMTTVYLSTYFRLSLAEIVVAELTVGGRTCTLFTRSCSVRSLKVCAFSTPLTIRASAFPFQDSSRAMGGENTKTFSPS